MGRILGNVIEQWRVTAALLFSAALIIVAYQLARGIGHPPVALASEEAALLAAIATKDTDADGLPDWEEALYGTDPRVADTRGLGMTDSAAVAAGLIVPKAIADITTTPSIAPGVSPGYGLPPAAAEGTLTDAFAKQFFTFYLDAKAAKGGAALSESELQAIQQQTLDALKSAVMIAPNFKSVRDLEVIGSDTDALKSYAAAAEAVLMANKNSATKGEIGYLKDALEKGDASAYEHIASIAKAYRESAAGLTQLPVPAVIAGDALALINALARISEINMDFTKVPTDPLAAIFALGQYPDAVEQLARALANISKAYITVQFAPGEAGAAFVNIVTDVMTPPKKP